MSEHIADNIKAVLFDHDDTLVGTIGTKWVQHKHVARTFYGKELTDEEITEHWGKPLRELVCLLYGTDDVERAMAHNTATHEDFPKELFTATIPTLRHINAAGKLIGIITATSRFSFEHDLTLHQVPRDLLDYTQTADDTPYHKPDPRVFEPAVAWLAEQHISPDEVVYIGDGLHDMRAAIDAGFSFLGVETGLVTAEQFHAENVKSIPSISDLVGKGNG
jgi:phosphoglycolate phosphatase-like HAD superfamily hydrolase